jgi:protein-tyrosine-phosphatase
MNCHEVCTAGHAPALSGDDPGDGCAMFKRILTVSVGNACRSPMAQALLRLHRASRSESVTVESGGGGFDVPDPYRTGRAVFEHALTLIERGLGYFERPFWRAA